MMISYYAARANLYHLWQQHPNWKRAEFAAALGSSKEWVKKGSECVQKDEKEPREKRKRRRKPN